MLTGSRKLLWQSGRFCPLGCSADANFANQWLFFFPHLPFGKVRQSQKRGEKAKSATDLLVDQAKKGCWEFRSTMRINTQAKSTPSLIKGYREQSGMASTGPPTQSPYGFARFGIREERGGNRQIVRPSL